MIMDSSAWFSLRLSLQVASAATLLVFIAGIVVAYLLAMKNFRGKETVDMLFTLPLVLPPTVTGYYLVLLFGRNGLFGRPIFEATGWSVMLCNSMNSSHVFSRYSPAMNSDGGAK